MSDEHELIVQKENGGYVIERLSPEGVNQHIVIPEELVEEFLEGIAAEEDIRQLRKTVAPREENR